MTMDEFYNSNILGMSLSDFNNISSNFLNSNKDNFIIVWLDTKYHLDNNTLNKDINEVNYLFNKINEFQLKYIYLLDENYEMISDIIVDYYNGSDEERNNILIEYS